MDLDIKLKAVLLGSVFLIVSRIVVYMPDVDRLSVAELQILHPQPL